MYQTTIGATLIITSISSGDKKKLDNRLIGGRQNSEATPFFEAGEDVATSDTEGKSNRRLGSEPAVV